MTGDGAEPCALCVRLTQATWEIVFFEGRVCSEQTYPEITYVCDVHKQEYEWRNRLGPNNPECVYIATVEKLLRRRG